jgi:hypothetical protein
VSRWCDPDKWQSPSFRKLNPQQKLVHFYINGVCNYAGFLEWDPDDCAFRTGMQLSVVDKAFDSLSDFYEKSGNWIFISSFLSEQRNLPLNPTNNAHIKIIRIITEMKDKFPDVYRELVLATGADKIPEKKKYNKKNENVERHGQRGLMR